MSRRAIGVGAIALSGCSLVYAGDLDAAHDGAPRADGGVSSLPDAAHATDAAALLADGATPQEAGTSAGCAALSPAPKFCDDFDGEGTVDNGWTLLQQGGTVAYDTSLFFSAPRSAKVTLATKNTCQYTRLEKTFEGVSPNRFELGVRIRPIPPWSDQQIPFALTLANDNSNVDCTFFVYLQPDNTGAIASSITNVQVNGQTNDVRDLKGFAPFDTWTNLDIVATPIPAGGNHYRVTFQPEGQGPTVNDLDFTQCPAWTSATALMGFHCAKGSAVADFDNLIADWP